MDDKTDKKVKHSEQDEKIKKPVGPPKGIFREYFESLVVTLIMAIFGMTFIIQAVTVPTGSMQNTILVGDYLLVNKFIFAPGGTPIPFLPQREIRRGDIIVFKYPGDVRQTFVKRVIGIPGDRIRLINKDVYLNGKLLQEPYKYHKTPYVDSYRDNFPSDPNTRVDDRALEMLDKNVEDGEVIVPPDCYFAMGDNRDSSLDSRYWGFVPRANIIGKPLIIYWSYDAPTERLVSSGIDFDHLLDLATNFFTKTRWKRSFMLIRGQEPVLQ